MYRNRHAIYHLYIYTFVYYLYLLFIGTFLQYFDEMEEQLLKKVESHKLKKGDDIVVMVLNEGELDLYLNFACSCKLHNISLHNVMVFAGSRCV
jgi:hypothetical protein